jgi:hypothetical protein
MKLVATTLLLGCAVFACKVAVQSEPVSDDLSNYSKLDFRHVVSRLWHPFSPLFEPAGHNRAALFDRLPYRRVPSKAEMLLLIRTAAAKHRVPAAFVQSIVKAESDFDCSAVSPKGAIGLMQLMPETAREYGADPTIPEQNIDAGTHYLRFLMDRYGKCRRPLPRVIAAYNAGPGTVDRYRGVPPFRETRKYIARVLGFLHRFEREARHSGASA